MKGSQKRNISDYQIQYKNHGFEEIMVEYRRKNILEQMSKYKCESILEIGCGNQPIGMHYENYSKMVIVEPGKQFYKSALRLKSENQNKQIICFNNYIEDVINDLSKFKFDFIILSSLLHELSNNLEILQKILLLCNKNTIVHINVPNKNSLHRLLALRSDLILSLDEKSDAQHKLQQNDFFDLKVLNELISKAGFSNIEHGSYFIKPFTHSQMSSLLDNKIIGKKILEGLYNLSNDLPNYGSEIYINARKNNISNFK